MEQFIGKRCVVRGNRSGVFYGTIRSINGQSVEMTQARKLWFWAGANAVEQIAVDGVIRPNECKFTVTVQNLLISDMAQLLQCTEKAIESIDSVKEWTYE
jgi:hypothetical protein